MGILDRATQSSRLWQDKVEEIAAQIHRAASLQAQARGNSFMQVEAARLSNIYHLAEKALNWREFGDIALHLAAEYPPDLAYFITYSLRKIQPPLKSDLVPYIFVALQNLHRLRPVVVTVHLKRTAQNEPFFTDPNTRGRAAASLIAREISVTPLRYASGIFAGLDATMQQLVREQLKRFNPDGAKLLPKAKFTHLVTPAGLVKSVSLGLVRVLFGKDE